MLIKRDANGQRLPASVLETWLDFRALAWGQSQTPALEFGELKELLGKGRSTLCAHLSTLRDWFGQRWEVRNERLTVYFDDAGDPADRVQESGSVQKAGPASEQEVQENKPGPESRTLDSPLKDPLKTDSVKEEGGESGKLDQKAGPEIRTGSLRENAHSKYPAIRAVRALMGYYPDMALYDSIVQALGNSPDLEKLKTCRMEWLERGNNPKSWKWATEWYVSGIPPQGPNRPQGGNSANAKPYTNTRPGPGASNAPDAAQLDRDRKLRAERDRKNLGKPGA